MSTNHFHNPPSRQDGRGYALNIQSGNTTTPKEDVDCTVHSALKESPMVSSSDSSVSSLETGAEPNTIQNNTLTTWPLSGIKEPGINDCLTGRGGGTNYHPGNRKYRKMVDDNKAAYKASSREDKSLKSMQIVQNWRSQDPPGRFLKLNEESRLWDDVGDEEARVKVSQALREKRPSKLVSEATHLATSMSQSNITSGHTADTCTKLLQPITTWINPSEKDWSQSTTTAHPIRNTGARKNLNILAECLIAIGIRDVSLLSGTIDEEFKSIKFAYCERIICIHPDGSPRNSASASFHCTRVAFEVLRSMFHKLRAQHSSFANLFAAVEADGAGDIGYINDLHSQCSRTPCSNHPSYEHFAMAVSQENPSICVALSSSGCRHQCVKCTNAISAGDIEVSVLASSGQKQEYGQWQHMNCWNVPLDIWLGLTRSLDPAVTLRDVMSMDDIFVKGFSFLDHASQLQFTRYLMNRKHWIIARANAPSSLTLIGAGSGSYSRRGHDMPPPGNEKDEGLGQKRTSIDGPHVHTHTLRAVARPLKKRVVVAKSVAVEKNTSLAGSLSLVTQQQLVKENTPEKIDSRPATQRCKIPLKSIFNR